MKKKIMLALSLLCLVALLCVLASCGHEHSAASEWKSDEANHWNACSVEGEECSEKLNSAAHTFEAETTDATCTTEGLKVETCTVCGYEKKTTLAIIAHDYADATCTEPKTCKVCSATDGEALGHKGGEATCTEPAYCDVCYQPYGEALGHKGGKADCITKATCGVCGEKYGDFGEHDWVDATCIAAKHCTICQAEQGVALGHSGGNATCTEAAICEVCSEPYGTPAGHKGGTANCSQGPVCDVCHEAYGEPMHKGEGGQCTECGVKLSYVSRDDVESITPSHEGGGSANSDKLFDGEKTTTGIYGTQDKEYFPSADGDYIEIVLKKETVLHEAIIWTCGNWTGAKIEFLDENGNVVFDNYGKNITYNGSTEAGDSTPITLKLGGVSVKTVRLTAAGIKWADGRTQKTSEIELVTNTPVEE